MRWFRDRSTTTKILLGFGLVSGVMAAAGLAAARGLMQTRENVRVLYVDYTVAGTDLAKVSNNLARYRNTMAIAAAAKDRAAFDSQLAALAGLRQNVNASLDAYAATTLRVSRAGRDEKKDLDRVRAAVNEYFSASDITRARITETWDAPPDEREACRARAVQASVAAGVRYGATAEAIDQLVGTVVDVAKDINDDGTETTGAALTTLVAGTGFAVLAGLVVAVVIARSITRPLGKTVAVLESLAQGDLTAKAEIDSRDEVGRMAATLDVTLDRIRTALDVEKVDWTELGQQRVKNADYSGQVAAIGKAQAVIEFKLDGTVTTANDNFLRVVGYQLAEIRGNHHSMFVDPGYAASFEYKEFWARLNRGEYVASEFKRIGKGGKEVWIQASYNPIFDPNGKPYKVVKYATDITATKMLEQKTKQDAEELRRKVDMILVSVDALAEGDFTQEIPDLGDDAVGQMGASLNKAVGTIRATLESVRDVAAQVADASGQLAAATDEIASGAQQQASSLEETASTLEEITATVKQNSDSAQQARQLASGSRDVAEKGGQVVGSAVEAMGEINHSSKKIADIITAIDEIAFQTNLLALNAAVEAARAGEQGRGFAVVAAEVRNLAQRSATAAKEIKGLIQDSVQKVTTGTDLVNRSGSTLTEIVTSVKRVTDIVAEIAAASREQATGIDQVNKAVTQMDSVTQRNASQTEELSATAQTLTTQAAQLRELVTRFKLDGGTPPAVVPAVKNVVRKAAPGKPPARMPVAAAANGHGAKNGKNGRGTNGTHELDRLGGRLGDAPDGFQDF